MRAGARRPHAKSGFFVEYRYVAAKAPFPDKHQLLNADTATHERTRRGQREICHPEEHSDEGSARWRSQKLIGSRARGARAPTPLAADATVLTLAKRSRSARATRATPNRLSAASASEQQIPRCARD